MCFVAIKLVVMLAWFLWRQRHVMLRQRHVIKVDPRFTSKVRFLETFTALAEAVPIVWQAVFFSPQLILLKWNG